MNIFSEMFHSVFDLKSYRRFLGDKDRKTFLFGFVLVLIYFLITVIVPLIRFRVSTGGVINLLDERIPDLVVKNSEVTASRRLEFEGWGICIFVDTDLPHSQAGDAERYLADYPMGLFMDQDQAVIKNNGKIRRILYRDIDPDVYWSKDLFLEQAEKFLNVVIAIGLTVIFAGMELLFFLGALAVALLGMLVASCKNDCDLTFGQLYKLGIYTRTTPVLIKALLSIFHFWIPFYTVISIGVSLLYLSAVIDRIRMPAMVQGPLEFSSHQTGPVNRQEDWQNRPGE